MQHAARLRLGISRKHLCLVRSASHFKLRAVAGCLQLAYMQYNALEKDHGTDISAGTHADMRASVEGMRTSAQTMEAPGSASVGDGMAAVDWSLDQEEGRGGWLHLELGAGQIGLEADDRWMR